MSTIYIVHIKEWLGDDMSDWFEGVEVSYEAGHGTRLHCVLRDQAELHALLTRIRDLGLTLVSVTSV